MFVSSHPVINSSEELREYVDRAHARRTSATAEELVAAVTMQKPVPFSRVSELQTHHSLGVIMVKIISSNGGIVMSQWPPDDGWLSTLQNELGAELRSRSGIRDFVLNTGVGAVYAGAKRVNLEALQAEPDVFLVDVGPVDVAEQHARGREVRVRPVDIFYEQEKLRSTA